MSLEESNSLWTEQYVGAKFSKRLEEELMAEHYERMLKETRRRIFESVVVSVLDKRRRIKGIGLNAPNDLILNNFGKWLAALIRTPVSSDTTTSLTTDAGAGATVYIYATAGRTFNDTDATRSLGTYLRVGGGATAPARDDYAIETPFGTSPESGYFGTGSGSYAAAAISFSGAITAGGAGTVREAGFFGQWRRYSPGANLTFMLFHDAISAVAFVLGNTITVAYTINL